MKEKDQLKENQLQSKVLVEFHGTMHHPLNIQSVKRTISALDFGLASSKGKKTVFIEASSIFLTHSEASHIQKAIKEEGILPYLMRGWLSMQYGTPSLEEAKGRIETISQRGLKDSVKAGIMPVSIEDYLIFDGLQALSEKYPFELEFESHFRDTVKQLEKGKKPFYELQQKAGKRWQEGKFDEALEIYKQHHQLQIKRDLIREKEIVEDIKAKINDLSRQKDGGFLFILFGSAHLPVAEKVKQSNTAIPAKIVLGGTVHNYAGEEIDIRLRKRELVPDELYARQLLLLCILHAMQETTDKDNVIDIGNRFDDFIVDTHKITSNLSLDQIRRICEVKMSNAEILSNYSQK